MHQGFPLILLYKLANKYYDSQDSEYEKLIESINNKVPALLLIQTIENARSRAGTLKRKYLEIDETDVTTTATTTAESSSQKTQSLSSLSY